MSVNNTVTFPSLDELRFRGTVKRAAHSPDVLSLWVAKSDATTCPAVSAAINEACQCEQFGYLSQNVTVPMTATADSSAECYGRCPNPDSISAVADVVRGVTLAVERFTRSNSATIVPIPAYMSSFQVGPALGREMVCIPTLADGPDLGVLECAFVDDTGCLILRNPNNPFGFTYSPEKLREITDLATRSDVRIISDEIHGPVVLDGTHIPTISVSGTVAAVAITVIATSKGWNIAGLRCAQIIFNDEDAKTWLELPFIVRESVSILGVAATTAVYCDGVPWLDNFVDAPCTNRETLWTRLSTIALQARFALPQASFSAWLDLGDVPGVDSDDPAAWLVESAKIALNLGLAFGGGGAGHVRLNFATPSEILGEALDRFDAAPCL